ncbi:hypothetical protein BVRB_9g217330 [Beta vulgaris subsp. vulgaris]|nr:hypothetical protein BVRB_9g217330 [Beta vulgaris subsp. vulgaris]
MCDSTSIILFTVIDLRDFTLFVDFREELLYPRIANGRTPNQNARTNSQFANTPVRDVLDWG